VRSPWEGACHAQPGPLAAAAINAVIDAIEDEGLLANVREREAQIRDRCLTGPVTRIQGKGLLLGLVCDRPAVESSHRLSSPTNT
jgi:acetylornithine/succinyldiaminopimelate/putrescine aminotransferase